MCREREGLRLSGEVDIATRPTLIEALDAAVAHPRGDILLDCSGVTFFGVEGVNALVRAQKELDRSGRRLVVRRPSASVRRILDILDLAELFADDADKSADPTPRG